MGPREPNLYDFIDCPDQRLKTTFKNPLAKERGITRLEITIYGNFIPTRDKMVYLLDKLNGLHEELGFSEYTSGSKSTLDVFLITAALMIGTAVGTEAILDMYESDYVREPGSI